MSASDDRTAASSSFSDKIEVKTSKLSVPSSTSKCSLHKWSNKLLPVSGIVVVYHGFAAHAMYPTVRYVAELLAQHGFVVYCLDMPGHGESPGERGLLLGVDDLLADGLAVAEYALSAETKNVPDQGEGDVSNRDDVIVPPLFLVGSSMGGAIALSVSQKLESKSDNSAMGSGVSSPLRGLIMLAPMLSLSVNSLERTALWSLSCVAPSWAIIPNSATSSERQYRDAKKRAECDADTLSYKGKLRCASACTCVELAMQTRESLDRVSSPFLCMIGTEDSVVDNTAAEELLMKLSPSKDKTLKRYQAMHGLFCEPRPLLDEIERDMIEWMRERCSGRSGFESHGQ